MRCFDYNGKEPPSQVTPIGQYNVDKIGEAADKNYSTNRRDISSFPQTPNDGKSPD